MVNVTGAMTAALKTVQVGQDHTPGASKLSASRAVSCLPADLADFLHSHRPHSAPTADATAPAWNGYLLTLGVSVCGGVWRWVTPQDAELDLLRLAALN